MRQGRQRRLLENQPKQKNPQKNQMRIFYASHSFCDRNMYRIQHHSKRKYQPQNLEEYHEDEEEVVDDLAVAASFALITSPVQEPHRENEDSGDSDEESTSDTSDSDESENNDRSDEESEKDTTSNHDNNDDENSDISDIDLSEQLAKMKDDDASDDGEGGRGKKKGGAINYKPTTQNEIDLYSCPISDLKEKLNMDLDFDDSKNTMLLQPSLLPGILVGIVPSTRISLAGHVKAHLVNERTIVVQSKTIDGMNMMSHNQKTQEPLLLDEGNLLLLKLNENSEYARKIIVDTPDVSEDYVRVVALGKILEVFGPVSKPLYTVRLKHVIDEKASPTLKQTEVSPLQEEKIESLNSIGADNDIPDDKPVSVEQKTMESNDKTSGETCRDPWAEDGVLTKWLSSCPSMEIYYSADLVKVVDTHTVAMNSRKGCDASNVYDEEVTDIHEMYFSDDEAERELKNRRKGKRNNKGARDADGHAKNDMNAISMSSRNPSNHSYSHGSNKQNMIGQHQNHPQYHSNPSFGYQQLHQAQQHPQSIQASFAIPGGIHPSYTPVGYPQYYQQPYYGNQHPPGVPPPTYPTPYLTMQIQQPNHQQPPYGVPPPPPPPPPPSSYYPGTLPPHATPQAWNPAAIQQGQYMYHQFQNGTAQSSKEDQMNRNDGDTVYYNYSGS